jgi:DNA-binding transcriptional MerR regulator
VSESENQGLDNLNEHPGDLLLTVKEVAQFINESPHVIRNWMRELKNHIPSKKGENNYHYFDKPAIERLLLIQKLSREQGYSIKQIEYYLTTGEDPLKPEEKADQQNEVLKELQQIREEFKKQEEFNQALLQKLEEQNKYIKESINKRDQQLLETMNKIQQARIESAAGEEKKKGFWSLFRKK